MERRADVIVVGLGAVGSAVLYQLADRGIDLIGIDRFTPPHDKGSSHGESRITRLAVSEGPEYVPFVRRSHELWRKIGALTDQTLLEAVGAVFLSPANKQIDSHGGHFVERALSVARRFGIEHERLDEVGLAQRFPQFKVSGPMLGYYEKTGGFVRPEACVEAQLLLARRGGAATEFGVVAEDLVQEINGVRVVTDRGDFLARRVVVAAGAWLPKLIGGALARLKVSRQVLFWFTVTGPELWDKRTCPIFIWPNGTQPEDLFYGFPMTGPELRIKVASETGLAYTGDLAEVPPVTEAEKELIYRAHVAPRLNGVDLPCVEATTCFYTEAPHYQFIVDRHPTVKGVTVVSACSGHGFKHSTALGEAIADQVAGDLAKVKLSSFTLSRLHRRAQGHQ
jgi:sarcosine oxidase